MLEGRLIHFYFDTPDSKLSAGNSAFSLSRNQDGSQMTVSQDPNAPLVNTSQSPNIVQSVKTYSQSEIDSVFKISEKRERQILRNVPAQVKNEQQVILPLDTISTKHNLYNFPVSSPFTTTKPQNENFFLNIPKKTFFSDANFVLTNTTRQLSDTTKQAALTGIESPKKAGYIESSLRHEPGLNWLVLVLLSSLFVFSLIKKMYQKYMVQVVGAVIDYQVANRLFRERNVLFRNVSFGLNLIFVLNAGLFIYFIMEHAGLGQVLSSRFWSMVLYCLFILLIYNIKAITCKFIGFIFLVQEEFAEYRHNISIFNKNTGLFLFPVVVVYPFVNETIRPFVFYLGVGILIVMILMRVYRGFQIIIRKEVPIFYLILYLCAIEILPVLLLIKFSSTLI